MTANDSFSAIAEIDDVVSFPKRGNTARIYLRILLRKAWLIAGITILTTMGATVFAFLKPSTYEGNFYLLVEPITAAGKLSNPSTLTRTEGIPDAALTALDYPTNLIFLKSPGMTYRIAQDVNKKHPRRTVAAIWQDLRENFVVEWVNSPVTGATKIFTVSYQGKDPKEVQAVLDVASQTFVKYSSEDRETSIKAGVKFIEKQLPNLQNNLNTLKDKQKRIRQQYELVDPTAKSSSLLEQIDEIARQKVTLEQQLISQKTLHQTLQGQLGISAKEALVIASLNQDPERLSLQKELLDLQTQLTTAQSVFTSESSKVEALKERYKTVQNLLTIRTKALLKQFPGAISSNSSLLLSFQDPIRLNLIQQFVETANRVKSLESQMPSIVVEQEQLNNAIKKLPTVMSQYNTLERDIKLTEEVLDKLLIQRETLKVESAQELPWQLISKPQIPLDENGQPLGEPPNRTKSLAAGFGGGLLFSILLALLWEKKQDKFFSTDDIEDILGLPLIGKVPKYIASDFSKLALLPSKNLKEIEGLEELEELKGLEKLMHLKKNKSGQEFLKNNIPIQENWLPFVDTFNSIYTELLFYYRNPPLRALAISSVQPGDGQSAIALNLAITAAEQGKRVLLVDTNGHKSNISNWLNLKSQKGLNYFLTHSVDVELDLESIIQEDPNHQNLYVITSGAEDIIAPKHLWSPKMEYLMSEFQEKFDLVIYDLPHFYETTDVYFMSACTDGMLLVVGVNKTSQSLAKEAMKKANDLRLPVLGVIANFV